MSLFRVEDRNVRVYSDPDVPKFIVGSYDPEVELEFIYYAAPVRMITDRLELEGYTIENCRRLFEEWRCLEIQRQGSLDTDDADTPAADPHGTREIARAGRKRELEPLRKLTVDRWIEFMRYIVENRLTSNHADENRGSYVGQMLDPQQVGGLAIKGQTRW
jgi:hypothetical protein